MRIILQVFVCLLIGMGIVFGQQSQKLDTLKEVEKLSFSKRFDVALALVEGYKKNHPNDITALRVYLKLLYWNGKISLAESGYNLYAYEYPNEKSLQLDYARFLFETGKLEVARKVLEGYILLDSINLEAKYLLGVIKYWQGEALPAQKLLQEVVRKDSLNSKAIQYLKEIKELLAPQVYAQSGFYTDQQPIQKFVSSVEAKMYRSNWLFPFVRLQNQQILNQNSIWWAETGNTFKLQKTGTSAEVTLGIAKYPNASQGVDWTGGVSVQQSIFKSLVATVGIAKRPYFYTLNSLKTPVYQNEFSAAFSWGKSYEIYTSSATKILKPENWNVKVGAANLQFSDNNTLHNVYGWFLSPPIKVSLFNFRIGYSYSYNNTDGLRYTSKLSTSDALSNLIANKQIPGIYDPYFTPLNQNINAILGSISIAPFNHWYIQLKGNYGFYAFAQAPYVYLDKNSSGTLYFVTGAASQMYTPFEFNAHTGYKISNKLTVDVGYTYLRAFFFDSQYVRAGLKYTFIK